MSENKVKWHKYPDERPPKYGKYRVSVGVGDDSYTTTSYWIPDKDLFENIWNVVTAWAEMPEPYKELKVE